MSKVSICIPAYNQAVHLKKTIDSVLCQTYHDYEIVITDDSPGTVVADLVMNYNLPDRIKYYKNASVLGSPENWNESIRKATGEYIKILHHDDWFNFEDSLSKYVQLLDENREADFAFSATQAIFPQGKDWVHKISEMQLSSLKEHPLLLYTNNLIGAPSTTIIRNSPTLHFDPNLKWHVDIEYYIRQIKNNPAIIYSPELLVVTFLADGRVSDECKGNKELEVFEYFYLLNLISSDKKNYSSSSYKNCILKAMTVCKEYEIKSVTDIRNCGYMGSIPHQIKTWMALNIVSPVLGKGYSKFLRNI